MKKDEFKKHFLKKLPDSPGVYFFLDKKVNLSPTLSQGKGVNAKVLPLGKDLGWVKNNILYIGKATSLKDRVFSYFSNDIIKTRGTKIQSMIENSKDIFFIETKSVLEAIILESKYIKTFSPFFNTKEKDDKSYSYVVFTKEEFPRVIIMRGREIEKNKDLKILKKFGPFLSKSELLEIMKFIRKIFPYRDRCNLNEKRGCFNCQIGLCPGVCIGKISKKDYLKNLKNIEKILSGNISKLLRDLEKEMKILAKEKKFEEASILRNKINSFNYLKDINFIKNNANNYIYNNLENNINIQDIEDKKDKKYIRIESYDISHISGKNRVGVMCVFEYDEFNKSEYKKFKLKESVNDDLSGLEEVLSRRFLHKEWRFPDILIIDGGKTHLNFIFNKLKNIISKSDLENMSFVSVVKDDKHKARDILYLDKKSEDICKKYNNIIISLNAETHRFAISYHRLLQNKIINNIKK